MLEYIRLGAFALLLLLGLVIELTAVLGVSRFRFSLNRIHAAGMGDTLGLMLIALAAVVYTGLNGITLKILAIVAFFWLTSPVSSHLIGRLVRETEEKKMKEEAKVWKR